MEDNGSKIEQRYEIKKKKSKALWSTFRNNLDTLMIVIIAIVYCAQGLFNFSRTGKSLVEIFGNIGLSFAVGLIIYSCLRNKGLSRAMYTDLFQASLGAYAVEKDKAKPNLHKLTAYCVMSNEQELENRKRELIENSGLRYDLWKKGVYSKENYEKLQLDIEQIKCIESVDKTQIERINPKMLLSDLPNKMEKYGRFGRDREQYKKQGLFQDASSMIMWATIFGYFTLTPIINEKTLATFLWNAGQVVMWLCFGVNKMLVGEEFMLGEYRQTHIISKTEELKTFNAIIEVDPHRLDKYDYVMQIEKEEQEELKRKMVKENEENFKKALDIS